MGLPITDLTTIVREPFQDTAQKYYGVYSYDTPLFYANALRWIGNDDLLIGVSARTSGPAKFPNRGQKEWDLAYLVDVPNRKVIRAVNKQQLLSEYKIRVAE